MRRLLMAVDTIELLNYRNWSEETKVVHFTCDVAIYGYSDKLAPSKSLKKYLDPWNNDCYGGACSVRVHNKLTSKINIFLHKIFWSFHTRRFLKTNISVLSAVKPQRPHCFVISENTAYYSALDGKFQKNLHSTTGWTQLDCGSRYACFGSQGHHIFNM